ncbi:winged helix-turn-helix domain-containing protein [Dokdonella sp.]|uniref:winged helix-turn-helix domain-containing protein n=1 Tax=Dokdonella sp. TaxID=2291710 RepID=UPI001B0A2F0B|nr:winged helix-turn-helix domain-containing protein [Dokdonella sp.]MBO9662686.1 winged helix-turn-helix domain-containing protein [Dokdonella sp.]
MAHPIYRFGDYRIDPSARELQHAGELVVLSPKVFDSLAYLIEHRDRAIGRDELIAAVWGKADVSDTLLGQTVLKARRAVGDTGNEQNAIRTVPRFGYRWIAPIQLEAPPADAPPIETASEDASPPSHEATTGPAQVVPIEATPESETPAADDAPAATTAPAPRPRSFWMSALAAAILAVAALGFWRHAPERAKAPAPTTSVAAERKTTPDAAAVLPVEVDAGGEWAWLRLGLMELIATRLRNSGQAVVPADNVVALARDDAGRGEAAALRVREATGARLTVLPSATRTGNEWVVHLLLRSADGGDREVEARSADVIEAGRAAADRLLAVLGKAMPKTPSDTPDASIAELLSRAEAALLTDDLNGARRLLESAPAEAQKQPDLRLRLVQIDFRAGQLEHARGLLDTLLKEVSAEADPVLRARILNGSGAVNVRQDKNAEAERDFGEAIALLENRDQPAALGQAYTGRGIAYAQQVRLDLAVADFSRARIALELAGDTLALARIEANEGIIDAKRGRYADALAAHERAAQRFERFGALNELILTLANAAEAQLALLRPADALATSDRAWALLGRLENPRTKHSFQITRVEALTENGRLLEARALLRELLTAIPNDGDPVMLARVQTAQAEADLADGQAAAAATLASVAVSSLANLDYLRERASAWTVLIRALRAQGRDEEAAAEVQRLSTWTATITQVPPPLAAALAEAEQRWAERQLDAARTAYEKTLRLAEQQAIPGDIAEVAVSYGSSLITDGELQRAAVVVGQVARWADRDFRCALLQVRLYRALGQADAWRTALQQARALAGERSIPANLAIPPEQPAANRRTAQVL